MKLSVEVAAVGKRIRAKPHKSKKSAKVLTVDQRRDVVETFVNLIEGLYAHLPRKRATYGHDPVQRLRSLQQRLSTLEEDEFHSSMAEIVTDLRDAHTRYIGPKRLEGQVAFLPILVERYEDDSRDHYIVSKIFTATMIEDSLLTKQGFVKGVEITHWNGVPIHRAVELYADRETGGRPDARKARALESLTFRPLRYAMPPDEDWIIVSFMTEDGPRNVRLDWRYASEEDIPRAAAAEGSARLAFAGDGAAETVRRIKKMLFATEKWYEADRGRLPSIKQSAKAHKAREKWITGDYQDVVSARIVNLSVGQFGLLRLWSFDLIHDDEFIAEVINLLEELPRKGLIIDLRGNPGGLIWAAERMLQLFTPHAIQPVRFSILATDMTRTMSGAKQNQRMLAPWRRSLHSAVINGEFYSRGIPLTPPERCNDIGQVYPGPIVAVVDANTYSAGDLFAAGLVDNRVGTLVSVDKATGAGGANVWFLEDVNAALRGTTAELKRLPKNINCTISFRRATRVGEVAGTGIEDIGIPGHVNCPLTKRDLTNSNVDLLEFCGGLLAAETITDLKAKVKKNLLKIETTNIDLVELYVDGHPEKTLKTGARWGSRTVEHEIADSWHQAEVLGYTGDILRQKRLVWPEGV